MPKNGRFQAKFDTNFTTETLNGRLGLFMQFKNLSCAKLALALGTTTSGASDFLANGTMYKGLFNIPNAFPELSMEWLWRGEGDMIKSTNPTKPTLLKYNNTPEETSLIAELPTSSEQENWKSKYMDQLHKNAALVHENGVLEGKVSILRELLVEKIEK